MPIPKKRKVGIKFQVMAIRNPRLDIVVPGPIGLRGHKSSPKLIIRRKLNSNAARDEL
jgi:hypothetical protein